MKVIFYRVEQIHLDLLETREAYSLI